MTFVHLSTGVLNYQAFIFIVKYDFDFSIFSAWAREASASEPKVFISYQWDVHNKVQEIKRILESNHIPCWIDNSPTITHHAHNQQQPSGVQRGSSSTSSRSTISMESETMQGNTQRNMKNAILVLCCMTPRYESLLVFFSFLALRKR